MTRRKLPISTSTAASQYSSLAAPLLCGFCVTLIGVLVQIPPEDNFVRWRDLNYLFLLFAAALYLTCLRFGIAASSTRVSDEALREYWPGDDQFMRARTLYAEAGARLEGWTASTFEFANTSFLSGILVTLVPGGSTNHISILRWAAIILAAFCVLLSVGLAVLHRTPIEWLPVWVRQLVSLHYREIRVLESESVQADQKEVKGRSTRLSPPDEASGG